MWAARLAVVMLDTVGAIAVMGDGSGAALSALCQLASNQFCDWSALRYSMRSVAMNAPWVCALYLVVASHSQVAAHAQQSHAHFFFFCAL